MARIGRTGLDVFPLCLDMTCRELELPLDRCPSGKREVREWKLPKVNAGGLKVPLARVCDFTFRDHVTRGLPRRSS